MGNAVGHGTGAAVHVLGRRFGSTHTREVVQGGEVARHEDDEPCLPDRQRLVPRRLHLRRHETDNRPLVPVGQEDLNKAIDKALPKMKPPKCSIYFNVTGKKVSAGTNPADFVDLMKKQLTNEVLWEPCIKQMIMDQVKDFYEVGPLKQIKSMIKRIDQDAFKRTENISV